MTSGFYNLAETDTRIIAWNVLRQINVEAFRPQ